MDYWTIPVRNYEESGSSKDNRTMGIDYEDLFKAYDNLQRENRALTEKHKSSLKQVAKLRKEVQTLQLRCAVPRQFNTCSNSTRCKPIVSRANAVKDGDIEGNKENLQNSQGQLQLRLDSAEAQLQMFRRESVDRASETQSKLQQLQSQHEFDVSIIQAHAEKLNRILHLHKEYQAKHRKLKEELHRCQVQKETLEHRLAEQEDFEDQVRELSKQNRFLEQKVRELSTLSRPKEESDKSDRRWMLQQLEKTRNECNTLMEENKVLREKHLQLGPNATKSKEQSNLRDVWQQLDRAQQRCVQKESELRQANDLLQAQIADNRTILRQQSESVSELRRHMIAQRCKTEDLTFKAASRLRQIRVLESQLRNTCFNSSAEVTVHSAILHGLEGNTKTFVLLSFLSFGSELSNIVSGVDPKYDLRVTYEMNDKLPQGCIHVEIYVLNDASPRLFAHASIPISTLLRSSATSQPLRSDLFQDGGEGTVGKLSLSMRLVEPTPFLGHSPGHTVEMMQCTGQNQIVRDAISVSVMSVTLSNQLLFDDQSTFFVHYRFLSFGGATTDSKMANFKGLIMFNHKSSFSIVATEPILEEISRGTIQFTLFSIRKDENVGEDTDVEDFRVVGEARVPLTDIWNGVESSAEIISLEEAKSVGSMRVTFETAVKPKLTGTNGTSLRAALHSPLMAMLTEVISTIGERDSRNVHTVRLLHFIDPPTGIMETAMILQHELKSEKMLGQSFSAALSLPPEMHYMHPSDLLRYSDEMHKEALLAQIPPNDEMEDLYQYLTNNDGQICIRDLDYFVSSVALKRLASACRSLREMNVCIRKDLLHNKMRDGGGDVIHPIVSVPELSEYFANVMEDLDEVDLIRLSSLILES